MLCREAGDLDYWQHSVTFSSVGFIKSKFMQKRSELVTFEVHIHANEHFHLLHYDCM
jgi:hypothetical protein